jgi:predicted dehydrogenase
MKKVKIGVIGAGGISHAHMGGYRQLPDVEIAAVADVLPGRAKEWAEKYDVSRAFEDYRELLAIEEIEGVSVCTYNRAHAQPTIDALRAGKAVLCEKPMAPTLEEAAAMLRAARETGKMLMIGVHSRFSRSQQFAKKVVASGTLGEIYYAEIVGTRRRGIPGGTFIQQETAGGGAVIDIGVYSLDTALDIMGQPRPVSVSAVTSNVIGRTHTPPPGAWRWDPAKLDVEEFGSAFIRFSNGAALVFKISWAVHLESLGKSFFLGPTGGLQLDPLEIYRDEFGTMVNITPKLPDERIDRFKEEMQAFTDAIRENRPAPIPAEEVVWTNVIMDGIYRSAAEGREVAVGLPSG